MRFVGKNGKRNSVINVTPLIDVMFLLVIFVLVTAKFETDGGIAVDLPKGQSKEAPKNEVQVISITKNGTIYLQKDQTTLDKLPAQIRDMRKRLKDPVVVINADKDTPYSYVARAADIIKNSGQSKFNLKLKP